MSNSHEWCAELKANSHDPAASMGTKHAPGEEQPDAITNVHDTAKGGKLHLPNAQHSPDASHIPTLSSLETLQDITTGSNQDAPLLPPSKPEAPSTVAELIAVLSNYLLCCSLASFLLFIFVPDMCHCFSRQNSNQFM